MMWKLFLALGLAGFFGVKFVRFATTAAITTILTFVETRNIGEFLGKRIT